MWPALLPAVAILVCAFWVPYLPTNDGPLHVLNSYAAIQHGDPASPFTAQLQVSPQLTNLAFNAPYSVLLPLFGWQRGLQIMVAVVALSTFGAVVLLSRALGHERPTVPLVAAAIAFPWTVYMGFFAFQLSLAGGVALVAYEVRPRERHSRLQPLLVGVGLTLVAAGHAFAYLLVAAVLVLVMLARRQYRRLPVALGGSLVILAAFAVGMGGVMKRQVFEGSPFFVEPIASLAYLYVGPLWRTFLLWSLTLLCAAGALRRFTSADVASRVVAMAAAASLVLGVVLPISALGWQYLSARFLLLGGMLALASWEPDVPPWGPPAAALGGALLLVPTLSLHRRLHDACGDYLSGLSEPRPAGWLLPIMLHPTCEPDRLWGDGDVPRLRSLQFLYGLYPVTGSHETVPYFFAGARGIHPFVARPNVGPPIPDNTAVWDPLGDPDFMKTPERRAELRDALLAFGTHYDAIVMFGARPPDAARATEVGYIRLHEQGRLFVGRFEGCRVELRAECEHCPGVVTSDALSIYEKRFPIGREPSSLSRLPCGLVRVQAGEAVCALRLPLDGEVTCDGLIARPVN